jgi:hypothetical protein
MGNDGFYVSDCPCGTRLEFSALSEFAVELSGVTVARFASVALPDA